MSASCRRAAECCRAVFAPELEAIGREYGPFDLTMLEIGAYHPAWGSIHLGPDNALLAHEMVQGKRLLPSHWGTFDLALHTWEEPAERLYRVAPQRGIQLLLPSLGQVLEPGQDDDAAQTPWWRELVDGRVG